MTEVIPGGAYQYKTRRHEKMRATRGMQNNFGDFMRRKSMTIEELRVMTL
jgi:hypothetical protein